METLRWLKTKLAPSLALVALFGITALAVELPPLPSESHASGPKPPAGKLFRFRLPFEPATLDWTLGDVPILPIQNAMRGLYKINEHGEVVPDLVESASIRDHGRRWVIRLKSGITWSDGVLLNAGQVTESLRRLSDPRTGSSYSYFLEDIEGAGEPGKRLAIKILSPLSFEIRLKHETPYFSAILSHWTTYPVRPDLIAKWNDYGTNPEHMAFLGSFRIAEWRRGVRVVLLPNPKAEKKPYFERVEGWIVSDDNSALNLFESDQLEFLTDPGIGARAHEKELLNRTSPISYFLGISNRHPLTAKPEGILALSAALNRAEIPKALGVPHRPSLGLTPPEIWENSPPQPLPPTFTLQGNAALARQYLKNAGFASPGDVPSLTLRYFERPAMRELAEWLQNQWSKNLGVSVYLDSRDPKDYWKELSANPAPLFLNSKGASYPDPDAFFRLFTSGNPQNLGRWSDSVFDEKVREAGQSSDRGLRRKRYSEASRRLLLDHPGMIPLYFRTTQYLIKSYVHGIKIDPLSGVDLSEASYE